MSHRVKIISLYIFLIICIIFQLIPLPTLQAGSAILFLVMLFIAKRWSKKDDPVLQTHARYYYRTVWIWSLLLSLGTVVIAAWLYSTRDVNELLALGDMLAHRDQENPELRVVINVALACLIPSFIYLAWRMTRGLRFILKDQALPNPKRIF